ncbi:cardiolipin synthase [bacterium]|nr:cardiolipin synthase [bacterium]
MLKTHHSKKLKKRIIAHSIIVMMILVSIVAVFAKWPKLVNLSTFWAVLSAISVITVTILIIIEKKSSAHTFAWLLILIFIPGLGIFFYLVLGRNFRKRKMFSNKELVDRIEFKSMYKFLNNSYQNKELFKTPLSNKISHLLHNNSKAFLSENNDINIYPDGIKMFDAMFKDVKAAKEHIHLEYFVFDNDHLGKELTRLLIKKAEEGVNIRIIVDDVGSWKFRFSLAKKLTDAGIECFYFNKVRLPFFNSRFNYRNHRKIVVIDGSIAYLGGLNIGDKYASRDKYFGYWRDTHMRIVGGSVYALQTVFLTDLFFVSKKYLFQQEYYPEVVIENKLPMQIVTSGPDSDWESIMQIYFSAITNAQHKIYITSPYLILNESLTMALVTAALSGTDVRIIVPGKADHLVVFWGTRSYYQELMEAGVKIYEYQRGFIHAKVMLIDGELCSIGTANMDIRSFVQNFEINGLIYDKDTTLKLEKQFFEDIQNSRLITLVDIEELGFFTKLKIGLARLFSPIL